MGSMQTFATYDLAPRERLAFWNRLTEETYPGTRVESPSEAFRAEMRRWNLGALVMIRPRSEASVVRREGRGPDQEDRVVLHLQHRGSSRHVQRGREAALGPGDFSLCAADEAYRLDLSCAHELLVVELPRALLAPRLPAIEDRFGLPVRGRTPAGRLFHDFLLSLWQQGVQGEVDADCEASIVDIFLDMVALAVRGSDAAPAEGAGGVRERLLALVEAQLCDPDLTSATLADALGISVRSVQNVFAAHATTPSAHILERRLLRAAERLTADAQPSVTAVAFDLGFNDSAYFARCFRQRFGLPPSVWRQRAAAMA